MAISPTALKYVIKQMSPQHTERSFIRSPITFLEDSMFLYYVVLKKEKKKKKKVCKYQTLHIKSIADDEIH